MEVMSFFGNAIVEICGRELTPETHAIVVADDAAAAEAHAARELQWHLERITGLRIPVVSPEDIGDGCRIVVGRHSLVETLGVKVDYDRLGPEGVRIRTVGPHLVLTGNPRGALYAVYVFLEEHLGCRWFTRECATWPVEGRIEVPDIDITHVPVFEYRSACGFDLMAPAFAVRNRFNAPPASAVWGGGVRQYGGGHTFDLLVPTAEYFTAHPEYFSEVNGKRLGVTTQLCLTHPEVLRIAIEKVRQIVRESPDVSMVWVSQNDHGNYCTCETCAALAAKEESQSGPLIHFVNAVAEAVAAERADVSILTLAYTYTRKPPRHVTPHPNVVVYLCSIECEFNRPLETSPFNRAFADDIRGWSRICSRLYVWDYIYNNQHFVAPFPDLDVLQPNIRFFARHNVKGVLEQGNYFSRGGELAELRTYLVGKLLWNPDYDVGRGVDEFLAAYYGRAAALLREYIDDLHRLAVSDPDFHLTIGTPPGAPFQAPDALARYDALFDRAEALVRNEPVVLHRVRVARLAVLYSRVVGKTQPLFWLTPDALVPVHGDGDVRDEVERIVNIARREGMTALAGDRGSGSMEAWARKMSRGIRALPVVRIGNGRWAAVVVPGFGGRILSLAFDGSEILSITRRGDALVPTLDGYKEFSDAVFGAPGFDDPFEVVRQSGRSVVLYADLPNGLAIRRRYELDGARLRIESSVINLGGDTRQACLRVHPCFHLADASTASLRLGAADGPEKSLKAGNDGQTAAGSYWLSDSERNAGEWALVDRSTGRTLISRFDPDEIGKCYVDWSGARHRVNLELFARPRPLDPLDELTIHLEYEVTAG